MLVAIYCLYYSIASLHENIAFYFSYEIVLMILAQVALCFLFPGFDITPDNPFSVLDLYISFWRSVLTWLFFVFIYDTESLSFMQTIAFTSLMWGEYILIQPIEHAKKQEDSRFW